MTRGIVIAGNESALSNALEIEAAKRVEHFAVGLIPNRFSETEGDSGPLPRRSALRPSGGDNSGWAAAEKARLPLQWNPGSPISAATLVIAAKNRLEHIDEALLICAPPSIRCTIAELPLADVEVLVNDHVKGWFFLARELAAVFRNRRGGALALVYSDNGAGSGKEDTADLLGPSSLAAFQALTRSLLASAFNEPYITIGFAGSESGDEAGFAAFIFKQLEEGNRRNNGKLHKYGKLNFFR
ncbi:MAG: hypothetical protein LBD18_01315 [Treponema sp.]|jgi:NAD(P)-dependent dehydrogenase (short-subunit alcohol dehydrogenase family)|nr:hypothetical protein [Treponema sp.]